MSIPTGAITKISAITVDEIGRVVGAASYGAVPITSIESSDGSVNVTLNTNFNADEASCDLKLPFQPFKILWSTKASASFVSGAATIDTFVDSDVFLQAVVLVSIEAAPGTPVSLDRFTKGTRAYTPETILGTVEVFAGNYTGFATIHCAVMSTW